MPQRFALVLVGVALVLAGCLGTSTGDDEGIAAANASDANQTTGDADRTAENRAPEASLEANQTRGRAPLAVSFTLNGSDEDGDDLNWTLVPSRDSQGSSGGSLPAAVQYTYAEAGNYTAVLTVDDGTGTDEATVAVTVTEADASGEADEGTDDGDGDATDDEATSYRGPEPVVLEGNATVGHPAHPLRCFRMGIDGEFHEIAPAESGWTYAFESSDGFVVYWWAQNDYIDGGNASGTVPSEATHAEVCTTEGHALTAYALTLWPPGHPGAPES